MLLLRAVKQGHRVVAISVDTGFLSPAAWDNLRRVPSALGVEQVIVSRPRAFRKLYRRTIPLIPAQPFAVCAACHAKIDRLVRKVARDFGCKEVWSGMTPDETSLLPPGKTLEDYRRDSGFRAPLWETPYDPVAVCAEIRAAGLRVETDPLKTNCAMNYVILHDYYATHRRNPYAEMFASHPWRTRARFNARLWLAYKAGFLLWCRNQIVRALR